MPEPRELEVDEIGSTIREFRHAAVCALEADADGVEIHAANGYLIHQSLSENANRRSERIRRINGDVLALNLLIAKASGCKGLPTSAPLPTAPPTQHP
jgi:hypothetical protein